MDKKTQTKREKAVKMLLSTIQENVDREGLVETPYRVAKMYEEIFEGYSQDPEQILSKTFKEDDVVDNTTDKGMVIVKDIEFFSHCEHHMVPFFGKVHIGYIPGKKVVGLSKLCRLVNCYAHRLQVQERLGQQIADSIMKYLEPEGVIVVIEAQHLCMKMRGVKNPSSDTVTSCIRGCFMNNETRQEFLNLIK